MKKILNLSLSAFTFLELFLQTGVAHAASNLCPPGNFSGLCNLDPSQHPTAINNAVSTIVTTLISAAIVICLIYLVYGGIKYITSGGDKAKVDSARSHLTAAIVGVVISLLAFLILNIVTYVFTGHTFNSFTLPTLY